MTDGLLADALDGQNAGWYAFTVLLIPVLIKFVWDAVDRWGQSRKTTIGEWQELFASTNKTLEDVQKELTAERQDHERSIRRALIDHNDCLRRYDQQAVRLDWVVGELQRIGGPSYRVPPWVTTPSPPSDSGSHPMPTLRTPPPNSVPTTSPSAEGTDL